MPRPLHAAVVGVVVTVVAAALLAVPTLAADGSAGAQSRTSRRTSRHQVRNCSANVGGARFDTTQPPLNLAHNLDACTAFSRNTCCNRTHVAPMVRMSRAMQVAGVGDACRALTEKASCFPCDPGAGVGDVTAVCLSLCDVWYAACANEFYAAGVDGSRALQPCMESSLVCSPLASFVESGAELCGRVGLPVAAADDRRCFSGTPPTAKGRPEPKHMASRRRAAGSGGLSSWSPVPWLSPQQFHLAAAGGLAAGAYWFYKHRVAGDAARRRQYDAAMAKRYS